MILRLPRSKKERCFYYFGLLVFMLIAFNPDDCHPITGLIILFAIAVDIFDLAIFHADKPYSWVFQVLSMILGSVGVLLVAIHFLHLALSNRIPN